MAFFTDTYLSRKRNEIMDDVNKVQYLTNGEWYDATIMEKTISGNIISVMMAFPEEPSDAYSVSQIRVMNAAGEVIAMQTITIEKNSTQNIVLTLTIPFQEV